jgi:uncharacterized protein YecE (DUF72 family)
MSEILLGTSGWSYEDWAEVVYPPGAGSKFDRLVYIAGLCDTIEVNSSFYHIPNRRTISSWLTRISNIPTFVFSAKLYQGLTHDRDPKTFHPLLSEYKGIIEPIYSAGRLAAILLQFPWSFKYSGESMEWLDRLVAGLKPMPMAVEVRHTSWLNEEYFDFLRSNQIAFCNIDQPHFSTNIPPTDIVTAPFSYVRLHGRNAEHWFTENEDAAQRYNYLYGRRELEEWTGRIQKMSRETAKVYVYANNHVGGKGLANALELKALLTGQKSKAPPQLLLQFPELKEYAEALETLNPAPKKFRKSKKMEEEGDWLF